MSSVVMFTKDVSPFHVSVRWEKPREGGTVGTYSFFIVDRRTKSEYYKDGYQTVIAARKAADRVLRSVA